MQDKLDITKEQFEELAKILCLINSPVGEEYTASLAGLPSELINHILSFQNEKEQRGSIKALIPSCKRFYHMLQPKRAVSKYMQLLQAIVDDHQDVVKAILDANPELLLITPPKDLVIESKFTWQKFFAENPLKMAASRKQLEMVNILLPYYTNLVNSNKLEQSVVEDALSVWKVYETQENVYGEAKIQIPKEYTDYAKSLVDVFVIDTFPDGKLSVNTESALTLLLSILVPKNPVKLDNHIDVELFLLAAFKAYVDNFESFKNWDQRDQFCIRVIGLIQSALSPETGKIWCQGLYGVVRDINNGKEIELDEWAAACKLYGCENLYRVEASEYKGLGFDHFVVDYGWGGGVAVCVAGAEDFDGGEHVRLLEELCQAKTTSFQKLHRQCSHRESNTFQNVSHLTV